MTDTTIRSLNPIQLTFASSTGDSTRLGTRIELSRQLDLVAADDEFGHVSLIVFELERLAALADIHGERWHGEVLSAVAERLERRSRAADTAVHLGGGIFVLLCPNTDEGAAVSAATRLVETMRTPLTIGDTTVQFGISVGVAHRDGRIDDARSLLSDAEGALCVAKSAGRGHLGLAPDRVIV